MLKSAPSAASTVSRMARIANSPVLSVWYINGDEAPGNEESHWRSRDDHTSDVRVYEGVMNNTCNNNDVQESA